jgi:DNA-binding Lrp family transcriptional regulator
MLIPYIYEQKYNKITKFIILFNFYSILSIKMNKNKVKNTDLQAKILDLLASDSKIPYREIASKLGISVGTVNNKIKQMEKEGIIKRYSVVLNYEKLGYSFEVLIFVKIKKGKFNEMFEKYIKDRNVFTIYDVTGNFDGVVSAKFKNRRELDDFIKRLQQEDYVDYTVTNLILNTMKEIKLV